MLSAVLCVQDPFGEDDNDLPLNSYQTHHNNVLQQLIFINEHDFESCTTSLDAENTAAAYRVDEPPMQEVSNVMLQPVSGADGSRLCAPWQQAGGYTEQSLLATINQSQPQAAGNPMLARRIWMGPSRDGNLIKMNWVQAAPEVSLEEE